MEITERRRGSGRSVRSRTAGPIERRAERQDGLLGPAELARVGRGAVAHRCRTGRWTRVRRGVVRVTGAPPSWRQAARAAVLSSGPEAFLSHASAARLYSVESVPEAGLLELSAPAERKIRIDGVWAHRLGTLEPGDVVLRDGIRCCSPVRLVLDLSGRLTPELLGRLVDELVRRRLLRLESLRERVERTRPAPGRSTRTLHAVLAGRIGGYDPGESTLEARIARVIRRHGFPAPVQQHWVRLGEHRYRLDFAYPGRRVYLEGDGFGFHSTASELDADARRRNRLVIDGWRPLTFTWRMTDAEIVGALDAVYDRGTRAWRVPDPASGRSGADDTRRRPNGGYGAGRGRARHVPGRRRRGDPSG